MMDSWMSTFVTICSYMVLWTVWTSFWSVLMTMKIQTKRMNTKNYRMHSSRTASPSPVPPYSTHHILFTSSPPWTFWTSDSVPHPEAKHMLHSHNDNSNSERTTQSPDCSERTYIGIPAESFGGLGKSTPNHSFQWIHWLEFHRRYIQLRVDYRGNHLLCQGLTRVDRKRLQLRESPSIGWVFGSIGQRNNTGLPDR